MPNESGDQRPLFILHVEDNPADAEMIEELLFRGGVPAEITRVETKDAFLTGLERRPLDLILCDYNLPQFHGLTALELARERRPDVPFIFVSGVLGDDLAAEALQHGAADYLLKDRLARLVPAVRAALHKAKIKSLVSDFRPAGVEVPRPAGAPSKERERSMSAPLRILQLEDNPLDAELLNEKLKTSGLLFEVKRVATRADFQAAIEQGGFDLILCDYTLPSFSGRDALTLALEKCPDVPFIYVSGTIGEERAVEALKAGATDYVLKDRTARLGTAIHRAMQEAEERAKRKRMEEEIHRLAYSDPVTGLPNRVSLNERLEQFLRAEREKQRSLALLLMNLSHFTDINNTLGHKNGDLLLQKVGQRLKRALPDPTLVAAPSGDRFAVLLQGDAKQATTAADLMLEALREPLSIEGLRLDIEATIGISLYPSHGRDPGTLFRRADIALSLAKGSQRRYALYDPAHDHYSAERLALVGELRDAIKENQLVLHYQPKADLKTGRIVGAEALMRWQHPKRGMIPPVQFIPLAEHTGLIKPLTEWAIQTALRQVQAWQKEGIELTVAVNLSARNLLDAGLPQQIGRLLKEHGVAPERLDLEITESVIMADPARAMECLTQLNKMGLRLSVDDFGTGYSSLAYLKRLPVHELKIDRTFVVGLIKDRNDAAIVRAAIDLGHALGLTQVAEGVENQHTWHGLMALGCDMVQGNFLSKPLSPDDFVQWLRWRREVLPDSAPEGFERH